MSTIYIKRMRGGQPMQVDRLFKIVYTLLDEKKVTAAQLSDRLEVSIRTIYRDIDTLSLAGIPIYASKGRGGGIGLLDGFVLDKTTITEQEQYHILMALQNLASVGNLEVEETLIKLSSLFQKTNTSWIDVDYSRWGSHTDKDKFELLKQAILNQIRISFCYFNSNGEERTRTVEPVKLVFKSRAWYVQGFCCTKKGYRLFRVNRMWDLTLSDEPFETSQNEMPPLESQEVAPSQYEDIILKFDPSVSYRVLDEFPPEVIEKEEDGSFIVSTKVPMDDWLVHFILSFGATVEVIKPKYVQEHIKKEVANILELYETR